MAKKIKLDSDIYLLKQLVALADETAEILEDISAKRYDDFNQVVDLSEDVMKKVETIKNGMSDIIEDLDDKNKRE